VFIDLSQEAYDIFGDVTDLLNMYDARKQADTDDLEAEQQPDLSDEEAADTYRLEQVCLELLLSGFVAWMQVSVLCNSSYASSLCCLMLY